MGTGAGVLLLIGGLIWYLLRERGKKAVAELKTDTLVKTVEEANEKNSRRARFLNDPAMRERLRTRNVPRVE
jgi:hypothetical protein